MTHALLGQTPHRRYSDVSVTQHETQANVLADALPKVSIPNGVEVGNAQ